MLNFSNLLEYMILVIYSEKESNQPGLEIEQGHLTSVYWTTTN